jgi:hypothetical protein
MEAAHQHHHAPRARVPVGLPLIMLLPHAFYIIQFSESMQMILLRRQDNSSSSLSSSVIKVSPPSSSSSTTATTHSMDHLFSHVPQYDTIYNVSNPFSMFPSITSQTSMGCLWLAAIVMFQRNGGQQLQNRLIHYS